MPHYDCLQFNLALVIMAGTVSRKLYLSILLCSLTYFIFRSYLNLLSEPTIFEEIQVEHEATFPSLTICARKMDHFQDNFTDFIDVMEALKELKENGFNARLEHFGKGVDKEMLSWKNQSMIVTKFNTSLKEIWNFGVVIQPWAPPPKQLTFCATLNVPQILKAPKQGKYVIVFEALEDSGGFYFERHEQGNSKQNYDFDETYGFEFSMLTNHKGSLEAIATETVTTSLKKSNYDCYEDNSMKMTDCINDFYADQLGCKLPWTKNDLDLEYCKTAEKLEKFRNLSFHITSDEWQTKLKSKGCLKPNCKQSTWNNFPHTEMWNIGRPGHKLCVVLSSMTKQLKRQEIRLYDFGTFLADVGSYLGLFLGASVLSISDNIIASLLSFMPFKA